MLFPDIIFIFCFFPIMLILNFAVGNYIIPEKYRIRFKNIVLFLGSIVFYAFGEKELTLLLLFSMFINWLAALLIEKSSTDRIRKLWLIVCIFANVSIFFVFKYLDFVIDNINRFFNVDIPATNLVLPIGISFFTFQAMSYVIDVYRRDAHARTNPLEVGLYISLFPQLVAGPIVRYETVSRQIEYRKETKEAFSEGVVRFITGLAKKLIIADAMAVFTDRICYRIDMGLEVSCVMAWIAAASYMLQIYFDFSAYSDMAIGLGKMFGFEFEENFNYPYISKSITEFWRRWHISLSSWFRDYVYIPLGGNRKGKARTFLNLFITWMLTGIWHGAGWTYIFWGLYNFAFLMMEKYTGFAAKDESKRFGWIRHLYAVAVTMLGWVIFRASCVSSAVTQIKTMFGFGNSGFVDETSLFYLKDNWLIFAAAIAFSTPLGLKIKKYPILHQILLAVILLYCVLLIVKQVYSPFIYFSF